MTENREHIYHAAMLDPHTAAELDLDQIWQLVDELLAAPRRLAAGLGAAQGQAHGRRVDAGCLTKEYRLAAGKTLPRRAFLQSLHEDASA